MTPSVQLRYALITPARNEAAFIEQTIRSVVCQTAKPVRWIVVSDGSVDGTDEIVGRYVRDHGWMNLVRMPEHRDRHFAAKVTAFNAGQAALADVDYDLIGNLDADITFEPDYFAFLLDRFGENPALGVAGTPFTENGRTYDFRYANVEHVSGACQMFRRACFEQIGGYVPIRGGAIDWVAVTTARMKGWQTRTFLEKTCQHHRPIGTGSGGALASQFKQGVKDYYVGGHPLWETLRSLHRMRGRPYVVAGLWLLAGYVWGALTRAKAPISAELRAFHRSEQLARLRRMNPFRLGPRERVRSC
jgi:poly-beta-1,6-N-acetyl-D-glucosamine synthase